VGVGWGSTSVVFHLNPRRQVLVGVSRRPHRRSKPLDDDQRGPGERIHARSPWAAARMGVGAAPAESPPTPARTSLGMCGIRPANPSHGRGVRPHPARGRPRRLALASRNRRLVAHPVAATTGHSPQLQVTPWQPRGRRLGSASVVFHVKPRRQVLVGVSRGRTVGRGRLPGTKTSPLRGNATGGGRSPCTKAGVGSRGTRGPLLRVQRKHPGPLLRVQRKYRGPHVGWSSSTAISVRSPEDRVRQARTAVSGYRGSASWSRLVTIPGHRGGLTRPSHSWTRR
jgi:hypothetical protein